jgi:hypothetical protein
MTTFYCLRFETPPTWRTRSLYLYPPGTEWPGYTPRHWVYDWLQTDCCYIVAARTTQHRKHRFPYCCPGVLPRSRVAKSRCATHRKHLPSTGHGADYIENIYCKTLSIVACVYFGRCIEMGPNDIIVSVRYELNS